MDFHKIARCGRQSAASHQGARYRMPWYGRLRASHAARDSSHSRRSALGLNYHVGKKVHYRDQGADHDSGRPLRERHGRLNDTS